MPSNNQLPITLLLIGGGWRAAYFLRIARELPDHFRIPAAVARDPGKGAALEQQWGILTYRTQEEMLDHHQGDYVVMVRRGDTMDAIFDLAERQIPILLETPPAGTPEALDRLNALPLEKARIQVAEQYHRLPLIAAQIAVAASGRIGRVNQVQLSVAHGYHGVSMIRRMMGWKAEPLTIDARQFSTRVARGPGRDGLPSESILDEVAQTFAFLDDGERFALYDFEPRSQYAGWLRAPRVLIRGEKGEIDWNCVRFLRDHRWPIELPFVRQDTGQNVSIMENMGLRGISLGEELVYQPPFPSARLNDDEQAVADCMQRMGTFVRQGTPFYSLAEASHDTYLAAMIEQSLNSGTPNRTELKAWSERV